MVVSNGVALLNLLHYFTSLLLKAVFCFLFNTNKTLEQKVKASMATSLHFIEHSIIIRPSEAHIYSRTDAFILSGFTTTFKAALNEWKSTGHCVSYIIMTGLMHHGDGAGEMICVYIQADVLIYWINKTFQVSHLYLKLSIDSEALNDSWTNW